jgi:hypothetical protein
LRLSGDVLIAEPRAAVERLFREVIVSNTRALPTSTTIASSTAQRLRCLAGRIHQLGPNPLFQLMAELSGSSAAMDRFEAYGALILLSDFIKANGGRDLPPNLRVVK